MKKPLDGVRVVDLTHVISGPYCTQILADMGAEVIKIERPGSGEFYRSEGIKNEKGVSIVYPSYNRNKKGITLNTKAEEGHQVIKDLVKVSDIFVENQKPGSLDKMGLGYEDLKKINPGLIYVSISGFGKTGPCAKKGAFDMTIAAISGLMSLNGDEDSPPLKTGAAFSDFLSGIYGALGATMALRHRDLTGEGQFVDISMLESVVSVFDAFIPQVELLGQEPARMGNRRAGYAPVNVFKANDGFVYIAPSFQHHWEAFAKLIGREDLLENPKYKTAADRKNNEKYLENVVSDWAKNYCTEDLVALLEEKQIPCAKVNKISEAIKEEQFIARQIVTHVDYPEIGAYPHISSPLRMSNVKAEINRAPELGEHNDEIFEGLLKYSNEEYALLKDKGVV